jgi:hypothetical protein
VQGRPQRRGGPPTWILWIGLLVCCLVLVPTAEAFGRGRFDPEGLEQVVQPDQRGPDPIQRMREFWQHWGKYFIWGVAFLLLVVALRIINPFRIYDSLSERLLRRSLLSVDDLLKRIQAEAETATEDAKKDETTVEEGLLAGLAEVAEFTNAEQVPAYVLTVNDLMLDNIRVTLKRLRRFTESNAQRYRDYMFSVLKGIKTLTEQSAEAGVASGLALDVREYFANDKRYQGWRKVLGRAAKRGKHRELARTFLLFMRDIHEGRPLTVAKPAVVLGPETAGSGREQGPVIPKAVNEETLPVIQKAAAGEARDFCALVQKGGSAHGPHAWQFELVRRQQLALKDEAQRMLAVFLNHERKTLRELTKIRMLPCRTWTHVLHLLGVESTEHLAQRIKAGLLTTQEILVLEKAFLQTFAKREPLARVYGASKEAGLMLDLHVPQIRRETLAALRQLHLAAPGPLADATQALNEEETPQNNQVKRLIEYYIQHRHEPPGAEPKRPGN